MSYGINPVVDLIKTGNITSGSLATGSVAHVYALNNENTNGDVTWSINSPAVITQVACAINSGESLAFPIGDVMAAKFISTGTVSKEVRTVNLKLDCDAEANINLH
jgi:type 1 fimbria pilin